MGIIIAVIMVFIWGEYEKETILMSFAFWPILIFFLIPYALYHGIINLVYFIVDKIEDIQDKNERIDMRDKHDARANRRPRTGDG